MEGRFIPAGALKIASKKSPAVAYLYSRAGAVYALGYFGKAVKPGFNYRFKSGERRMAYISEWLKSKDASAESKVQRKEAEKAKRAEGHKLKVGSVLRASWGYDQTNIDFFEVVELVGKCNVKIRELCQERKEGELFMQGECVPLPGSYKGEAMLKRVGKGGDCVKIYSFASAYLVQPIVVAGKPVGYGSSHWTAYA